MGGLMGVATSAGGKALTHSLSFGLTLTITTNLAQLTYHTVKRRTDRGYWQQYGPLYLVCTAVPLVMADLTRRVLQDANMWTNSSLSAIPDVWFTKIFAYVGFFCLIVGNMWSADIPRQI